jgi:pimeloyl-ACP methyl ester carboxylesterase
VKTLAATKRAWLVALIALGACSGEQSAVCEPAAIAAVGTYDVDEVERFVPVLRGGEVYQVYVRMVRPAIAAHPDKCFPLVLRIPGGWGAGAPLIGQQQQRDLATAGFVVVAFNAESRGSGNPGDLVSDGPDPEDYNGFAHQDDCAAVLTNAVGESYVDSERVVVWSHSNGITIASGCLSRHPELHVKALLDEEGPHCPRDLLLEGSGAQIDPDLRATWLNVVIPAKVGDGRDYATEDEFWAERCAVDRIGEIGASYQRLQFETDHALGVYYDHTVAMVNAAVAGGVPWVRLNDGVVGASYSAETIASSGVILPGALAGAGPEVYSRFFLPLLGD